MFRHHKLQTIKVKVLGLLDITIKKKRLNLMIGVGTIKNPHCYGPEHHALNWLRLYKILEWGIKQLTLKLNKIHKYMYTLILTTALRLSVQSEIWVECSVHSEFVRKRGEIKFLVFPFQRYQNIKFIIKHFRLFFDVLQWLQRRGQIIQRADWQNMEVYVCILLPGKVNW